MMSNIRKHSVIAAGLFALGAAQVTLAGLPGVVLQQIREQEAASQQPAPQPAPRAPEPSAPANHPSEPSSNSRSPEPSRSDSGNGQRSSPPGSSRSQDRGRDDRDDRGRRDDHHDRSPPRVVYRLPPGYRNYYWDGVPYYTYGGEWFGPYGDGYVTIGAPYGLFVSSLPGISTSFYFGNTRYYRYDDTYYTYDNSRRGYVVTPSPYEKDARDDARDEDLFIYPAQGQSEQQQADDRYACHRWAVKESGHNPLDDAYDSGKRSGYARALTACLTGRGYSVR